MYFERLHETFMAAKLYFIFCTLYNLHKLKMAVNRLKTDYYNYNEPLHLHFFAQVGSALQPHLISSLQPTTAAG